MGVRANLVENTGVETKTVRDNGRLASPVGRRNNYSFISAGKYGVSVLKAKEILVDIRSGWEEIIFILLSSKLYIYI